MKNLTARIEAAIARHENNNPIDSNSDDIDPVGRYLNGLLGDLACGSTEEELAEEAEPVLAAVENDADAASVLTAMFG